MFGLPYQKGIHYQDALHLLICVQSFSFEAIDRSIAVVDCLAKVWSIGKSIALDELDSKRNLEPDHYFIYLIYITCESSG